MSDLPSEKTNSTEQTTCCIVGAGPAGVILSFLLARQGIPVALLEAHKDLDRDFRGDTIHPSTLELLDQLGLAERLHQLPHNKLTKLSFVTAGRHTTVADISQIRSKFPHIMIMPQAIFLDFLVRQAQQFPTFHMIWGANVQELVEEDGHVQGVRYRGAEAEWHEVRALLTVGADGRFSRLRKLAGFEPIKAAPPMDVVWFRLPRKPEDDRYHLSGTLHIEGGRFAVIFDRPGDQWQIGYVIVKGSYAQLKADGVTALREGVARLVPPLADRVHYLESLQQVAVLSVESSFVPRWYKPGLLLIGDAAHVMSPVGGIGIQYAIQDAVEAANLLTVPLQRGQVEEQQLAAVQQKREKPVQKAQRFQGYLQQRIVAQAIRSDHPFRLPLPMRILLKLPYSRNLPARIIGHGFGTARLQDTSNLG
ncbi:MAG TPA: FAD-dependent oxidoreductase [Candidatus Binatia bacterium]|jgi:2-polyprenyl-6-methoxyphenol hydroxylase-like FAD-dependent oxidoreductase|nr:FAD-dependent oxidoreductase [Candidatus Binatia bacterium]